MRKFILILVAILVVAGGALAAALFLVPADFYKAQIEQQGSAMLGRALRIDGPVSLSIFPSLQVRAQNVSLANPPGFSQKQFAAMQAMHTSVALLPLLTRQVHIKQFILVEPKIVLERRRDGAVNWALGSGKQAAGRARANSGFKRQPGALPLEASLGKVRLVGGDLRYIDHGAKGNNHHLAKINISLSMPALSRPVQAKGRFVLDGQPYQIEADLGGLKPFLEGAQTPLSLKLKSALFAVNFDGAFDKSRAIAARGTLSLQVPSVRKLAAAAGTPLSGPEGVYGAFDVSGQARANTKRLSFKDAKLRFDEMRGSGSFGLIFAGARPRLSGRLAMDKLDLTPYLPPQGSGNQSLAPWSTAPIDLGVLRAADSRFSLELGALQFRQIKIGKSALKFAVVNGRLQADLTQMALYGGSGTGKLVANARGAVPSYAISAALTGVQFQPLLSDSIQFKRLAGTGSMQFALRSSGRSQAQIMSNWQGQGSMRVKDGQIIGVNLASVMRGAQGFLASGVLPAKLDTGKATDFSDMSASFTASKGVLRTDDFLLQSPLLRVPGEGMVDLGAQRVDFRLTPRAVASLKGQGGKKDVGGLGVPFRIHGPWSAVKDGLDKSSIKKQAKKKIGNLIKKNLFGTQDTSAAPASADSTDQSANKSDAEQALDALSGLFGKKKKKKKDTPPPN